MKRIPALDGLRAVAVTMVLIVHCFPISGGVLGVDIFFVLSGFLITRLFVVEFQTTGTIALLNFYIRRFLRLMPCLALVVGISLIAAKLLDNPRVFDEYLTDGGMALAYVSNWWQIVTRERRNMFSHTWSLSIEEQFYILWGIGAYLTLRHVSLRTTLSLLLFTIACVYVWRGFLYLNDAYYWRIFHGFDTRADELIGGCAAAVIISMDRARKRIESWLINRQSVGIIALVTLIIGALTVHFDGASYFFIIIPVLIILSSIIIFDVTLNENSMLSVVLSQKYLVNIGVISYGIYLWHFSLLDFVRSTSTDYGVLRVIVAFGVAPITAALSFRYFEAPILALKYRLKWIRSGRPLRPVS